MPLVWVGVCMYVCKWIRGAVYVLLVLYVFYILLRDLVPVTFFNMDAEAVYFPGTITGN